MKTLDRSHTERARSCNARFCRSVAATVFACVLGSASAMAQQPAPGTVEGKVSNGNGTALANVRVRLEHAGSPAAESTTNSDGRFAFGEVAPGDYIVSAENGAARSVPLTVHMEKAADEHVDLVIADSNSPGASMEFSDTPNFTIAAVTDWTAAGGHGSDAVLRTSEALNREALSLKSTQSHSAESTAEWQKAESTLRADAANAPGAFGPNQKLGEFYLSAEKFDQAVRPLETAHKIEPDNFDNEYDLALALKGDGKYRAAHDHIARLGARRDNSDIHRIEGELDENLGDPLNAVHEFERAVRLDPSEENYFEWGSELLLHRAVWQAKDVFSAGVKAYPKSERMLTALGAALFAGALYDDAAQRLCEASDLNPDDPEPYRFMGKIEISAPNPLPCIEQKLARFVAQRPNDPLANYFYAMALWKQKGQSVDAPTAERVEGLLNTAIKADPQCGEAYLQLGVLESTRRDFRKAIEFYSKAIEANPEMSEAHYRLGGAYDRVGEKEKAAEQFRVHDEMEKQQAAAVEKQRREVKQFLVVVDGRKSETGPQ